jgi:hypothetical protein
MHVHVLDQRLAPGMQHHGHGGLAAQVALSELDQRRGRGAQEEPVE